MEEASSVLTSYVTNMGICSFPIITILNLMIINFNLLTKIGDSIKQTNLEIYFNVSPSISVRQL
jgi:hypothetical protein